MEEKPDKSKRCLWISFPQPVGLKPIGCKKPEFGRLFVQFFVT
jgi:hypothetical protein